MHGAVTPPPDPEGASTAGDFVAALGRLRQWSGLTYRQLAAAAEAAGRVLPASTTAGALGRTTLPKEEFVVAFVQACGLGDVEAARWVAARKRLASGAPPPSQEPAVPVEQPEAPADPSPSPGDEGTAQAPPAHGRPRRWRLPVAAVAIALVLVAGALAVPAVRASWTGHAPAGAPSAGAAGRPSGGLTNKASTAGAPSPSRSALPARGWYRILPSHVADRDLCIGEGRERSGRTDRPLAVQRPCRGLVPDTFLSPVGDGKYEIQWHHPVEGAGCLTVDEAETRPGALLAPATCTGAAHQHFLLEPAGRGFSLRPAHSGLCLGALYGEADVNAGAELAQQACTGKADQIFLLRRVPTPPWTTASPGPK
ncbi:hypothetical protein GCM10009530_27450 [Microbispora corallina]|uniref:Ricin B lectin domain-containing protein n=1 Tax=Microbispora corallina TaxID=83302 RepID=A0ABQ4FZA5_9ACTN|nr:RICIN domain-containing protein [Microbispora corallina]GIH40130.1 hypothetical protein Mco01_31300 [Microbispora corallina]